MLVLFFLPRDGTQRAILLRQFVRLSVCDVELSWIHGQIGCYWNTSKIISWLYRLAFFCLQPPTPKGTAEILTGIGHYRVG